MRQRPRPLVIGGMCPALRCAAQSEQGIEPAPGRSIGSGTCHQLASPEPVAQSLHPSFGAATPAQQGDRGYRARAMRFYLGTVAYPRLLPSPIHTGLKKEGFEGNSTNKQGGGHTNPDKTQRHYPPKQERL